MTQNDIKKANDITAHTTPLNLEFSEKWIEIARERATARTYPKGTVIISEGDQSDGLFIMLSGKARVYISDEHGKEMVLAIIGAGEFVGEIASLDGSTRTASVETLVETRVLQISRDDFKQLLAEQPDLSFEMIQLLTQRIRSYAASLRGLAFKNVYGRIVSVLNEHAHARDDGTRVVTTKFTQQEIADMVGSSREMVSRVFSELSKGEYINVRNKVITIHRPLPKGW